MGRRQIRGGLELHGEGDRVTGLTLCQVEVNGSTAHPLFTFLKTAQPGFLLNAIKWNFTKFVISRQGVPVARWSPVSSTDWLSPGLDLRTPWCPWWRQRSRNTCELVEQGCDLCCPPPPADPAPLADPMTP